MKKILLALFLSYLSVSGASSTYRTVSPLDVPPTPRLSTTNIIISDGVFDCTLAIQAAVDALPVGQDPVLSTTNTSGAIYFPPGKYKITAPIKIHDGIVLKGSGYNSTVIINNTGTENSFELDGDINANAQDGIVIQDMTIRGSLSATGGTGILLVKSGSYVAPFLDNVRIVGHKYGLTVSNMVLGVIKNVQARSQTDTGISFVGTANAGTIQSSWAYYSSGYGWHIPARMQYCTFLNCAADGNALDGWRFGNDGTSTPQGMTLISCGAEANGGNGFTFLNCDDVVLSGCLTYNNSSNSVAIYGGASFTFNGFVPAETLTAGRYYLYLAEGYWGFHPNGVALNNCSPNIDFFEDTINAPEYVTKDLVKTGYRMKKFGSGYTGVTFDYKNGGIGIGDTNLEINGISLKYNRSITTRNADVALSEISPGISYVQGDGAYLKLAANSDTNNYYTQLQNLYNTQLSTKLVGSYGSSIFTFGQPAGGLQQLTLFPLANASGYLGSTWGAGRVSIGYTNAHSALTIKGGLSIGITNEASPGEIILPGGISILTGTSDPGILSKANGSLYINSTTGGWFHRTNDTWEAK